MWKNSITTLLSKPGTAPTLNSFKLITLLAVEYKLYTAIITDTLLKWALENNIILSSQNRTLPDRRCDMCLWALISTINKCNKKDHLLHVYYIDYSKAFDSVKHWVIDTILKHLQVGHIEIIINSLLQHSFTKFKYNNQVL